MLSFFSNLLSGEKAALGSDLSGAADWFGKNWKRILSYAALWYVSSMWGPAAGAKAQAILKVIGL